MLHFLVERDTAHAPQEQACAACGSGARYEVLEVSNVRTFLSSEAIKAELLWVEDREGMGTQRDLELRHEVFVF